MSSAENKCLLAKYIPFEDVEELLQRSKQALKREIKILNKRASIERRYARALDEWVDKTKRTVDLESEFDHKDIRLCLMVCVREGEATALLHDKLADLLTQSDSAKGPVSALSAFKVQHFKKSGLHQDLDMLRGKEKISSYLDQFIKQYKSTLKECMDAIKQAEHAARAEIKVEEQIQERADKLSRLENLTARNTQNEARANKWRHNIRDLKSQLDVMSSKRENFTAKAKLVIQRRVPILDDVIQSIEDVEVKRIKVFNLAVGMTLEHVGILGPEAIAACKSAREQLANINPKSMVTEWRESKKTSFKITEKEELQGYPASTPKRSLENVFQKIRNITPPVHLFVTSTTRAGKTNRQSAASDSDLTHQNDSLKNRKATPAMALREKPAFDKTDDSDDGEDSDSSFSYGSRISEHNILLKFFDNDHFLTSNESKLHWVAGNQDRLDALRARQANDPFEVYSGRVDVRVVALFEYTNKDLSLLNLKQGQHIQMKYCNQACAMGWGWTNGPDDTGPKVYGKFPLFCTEPI